MNYLISQYPVTHDYLDRLSEITGTPLQSVVVSTITAQGHLAILRRFRALKCDVVYIPAIDASALPLLAPLRILSMLVRTRRRFVVRPDYSLREFGFFDAFWGGLRMTWGMLSGFFEAYRDWRYLGKILKAPRRLCSGTTDNRVLYINTNLWLGIQAGGAVAHISGVVKGLLDKGHEVLFASVEAPVALPASKMLATHRISPRNTYVIPRDLNHYRHNPLFFDALSPLFRSPIGFIYQRLSLGSFAGVMLSRHHGVPLVIEYNGSEKWLANNWGSRLNLEKLAMRAENACLRHAHLVVTVSDVLKQDLIDRGVDPERVVFHPNGVDPDLFDPQRFTKNDIAELRKSYGISADSLVVTFVGTFGPWHGAEVFARSVAELAAKDREWLKALKLHFFFIGDGARRRNVEDFIARKRIQQFVSVTGLIDQEKTPQHLAASDILVSPHVYNPDGSPFFGSPTKLFEYLAASRPVIASDLGQIGEVLDGCPHVGELDGTQGFPDEACGILVKPESSGELTAAIRLLAENQKWRNTAGLNAHARALNRYTWGHHVKAVVDGLDRVRALDATAPRPRVRVLFNGLHSKSGGGLTYLKNILPLMADDPDIDLHLCVHEDQRTFLPDAMENITIHYLNFKQGFWNLQVREQIYIPRLAKQIGASATFSPANYGPLWAPNPVVLLRNALSVAFVERRPVKLAYWALVYVGTILSLLTSRRAITVSDYARRAAGGGVMGFFKGRLSVVPHGVSEIFSPPKKGAKRKKFLLAVSDIYVQKNLKNLLCAVALLSKDHPDIFLRIAGRPVDEEYFAELKNIVSEEKLDGMVEFLGGVSPKVLVSLYQSCGVFVFPSTVETFGNPLVEAMACGAPIASSNTAAMPEVLGDAAEYFDPGNVQNMAETINRLMNDHAHCRDLSAKAEKRAKDFSWKKTAESTLRIIKEAAQPR